MARSKPVDLFMMVMSPAPINTAVIILVITSKSTFSPTHGISFAYQNWSILGELLQVEAAIKIASMRIPKPKIILAVTLNSGII